MDTRSALAAPYGPQAGKWDSGEELEDPVHTNPRGDKIMLNLTQITIYSIVLVNQDCKEILIHWFLHCLQVDLSIFQIINGLESWFRPPFIAHRPPNFKVKVLN